jgi:hypothetical protein
LRAIGNPGVAGALQSPGRQVQCRSVKKLTGGAREDLTRVAEEHVSI